MHSQNAEEVRWGGELEFRDFPSDVEKHRLVWNINILLHSFFSLNCTFCHSHCKNHLSSLTPCFSSFCCPLYFHTLFSPIPACHLSSSFSSFFLHALLSWFPSNWNSHITGFLSSTCSLSLLLCMCLVTGGTDDRQSMMFLRSLYRL